MPSLGSALLPLRSAEVQGLGSVQSVNQTAECTVACAAPVPSGALCSAPYTSWRALVDKALASSVVCIVFNL